MMMQPEIPTVEDEVGVCLHCDYENHYAHDICENCGQPLDKLPETLPTVEPDFRERLADAVQRSVAPDPDGLVMLYLDEAQTTIVLQPRGRTILGRIKLSGSYASRAHKPDVDLTAYDGFEKGVSRLHAALHRDGDVLTIRDLDSSNGTYVNGVRLAPGEYEILNNGDQIHLGRLALHITFN